MLLLHILPAVGLVLFFVLVVYVCLRERKPVGNVPRDAKIPLMRKSPLGRWRY